MKPPPLARLFNVSKCIVSVYREYGLAWGNLLKALAKGLVGNSYQEVLAVTRGSPFFEPA